MTNQLPHALAELLSANDPEAQELAWERFVTSYSDLLLQVAQSVARGYDAGMDGYTFVLERLRARGYERHHHFAVQPRGEFTAWQVVVARRLCLDLHRHRYGRIRGREPLDRTGWVERAARRRLADAVFDPPDALAQVASKRGDPETEFERAERRRMLDAAIATLSPADRRLLTLRFEDELPARAIAATLGFRTACDVYRRMRLVLSALREQLGAAGAGTAH
jgi:RNA polymerase sigma factor (sigma-70 family)